MDILQIDEILLKILSYLDIDSIWSLLLINKFSNNKIFKYYQSNDIVFNDMPLFRSCNNISTYITHYKSYISGENFSDEPLWLFDNKDDPIYIEINSKYVISENININKPKFLTGLVKDKDIAFKGGLYHWSKLNNRQKYLVWCAIKNIHPELKLDKLLVSEDMITLLSEMYYHYQYSFVRYYLEIYGINKCSLLDAKCTAGFEIERELQFYREFHFYWGYQNADDKDRCYQNYFDSFMMTDKYNGNIEKNFRVSLMNQNNFDSAQKHLFYPKKFDNLDPCLDKLEMMKVKINFLIEAVKEIDQLDITNTINLKTSNINYLEHMIINYTNHR